ncbi:hypothetical protein DFP72DRAFT_878086 [Ephemerocybe angulata]|uniref:Glycosyl transferase CAP10 domain-containing protein n=1 Tax=Ephemerocybe angulata TaxID=980116 RepID=A0A8H6ICT8_9AGAR|nr:hypothetical protein DFP72DRAFT_878086 [Tulosesus angulatus]
MASSLLNAVFGRQTTSKRSPPQHTLHFHRDSNHHAYPPRPAPRRRFWLTSLILRYIRRPVILVTLLGFAVWFAGVFQEWYSRSGQQNEVEVKDKWQKYPINIPPAEDLPFNSRLLTVTKTSTLRLTQTVTVVPQDPSSTSIARDAFGFLIVNSSSTSVLLQPPPSEKVAKASKSDTQSEWDSVAASSSHFYRADGLVEVSPSGSHPIFELISRAELLWDQKHKKASKTLKEAYIEYQKRYGRRPPQGFDIWWTYVQSHSVQLPDEYNQIDRDLSPFWGVDPSHLRQVQRDWEAHADSYTIGKEKLEDYLVILNYTLPEDENVKNELARGATMVIEILEEIEDYLRPFRAIFSPHDNPNLHSDWELREEAKEASKAGKYLDMSKNREHKLHGWRSSCPPFSAAWVDPIPYTPYPPPLSDIFSLKHKSPYAHATSMPLPKTFIHDHRQSMDPCLYPAHLLSHGQFLSHGTGPVPHRTLIPQFGYSPTTMHDDMMAALPFNWVEDVYPREEDPPFAEKEDMRLHWRGRNTGMWHGGGDDVEWSDEKRLGLQIENEDRHDGKLWWLGQRGRLVDWANKMWVDIIPRPGSGGGAGRLRRGAEEEEVESGIPVEMRPKVEPDEVPEDSTLSARSESAYPKIKSAKARVLRSTPNPLWAVGEQSEEVLKAKWAPAMADIAYAGEPLNCDGRMCERLRDVYEFRKVHDGKMQGRYKFVMDVDGNGWSSRFKRLITSNACIFKATIYPEWYTDRIAPWVHFVPVQLDLSDLLDSLYFFRGDPSGNNGHLDLAEKIALAGREWSLKYWRRADMTAYMFRLFLEYARVMHADRDVTVEMELDQETEMLGAGVAAEIANGKHGRKLKVMVGKQDYVYREEDEYIADEQGSEKRDWDWRYKTKPTEGAKE